MTVVGDQEGEEKATVEEADHSAEASEAFAVVRFLWRE
jgi:hypothetical protein